MEVYFQKEGGGVTLYCEPRGAKQKEVVAETFFPQVYTMFPRTQYPENYGFLRRRI